MNNIVHATIVIFKNHKITCSNSSTNCNSCKSTDNRKLENQNDCVCMDGYIDKLNSGKSYVLDLTN